VTRGLPRLRSPAWDRSFTSDEREKWSGSIEQGTHLPFADGMVATLLLVNMLLFPAEVDRVLDERGALVWVSSTGPHTPIYLSPEEIEAALPGDWDIVGSDAGRGTWCVARRA
jgi:hypothetical protein